MKDKCDELIQTMGKLSDYDNDSLTHFGIMGMRWGKRKVRYLYTTTGAKQDAKDAKNDAKDAARRAKKGAKMYRNAVADTNKWEATVAKRKAKREASQKREADKVKADKKFDTDVDAEVDNIVSKQAESKANYDKFTAEREAAKKFVDDYKKKENESLDRALDKQEAKSKKYNNERSGPILSSDEVNSYKSEKDNTGLVVRDRDKSNNDKSNNDKSNNDKSNNDKSNNDKSNQEKKAERAAQEEQDKKVKAEKSIDRLKVIGASGKVAQTTVTLGQTIVKNKFEADNKKRSSQMSDEELKTAATRMELENRYMNAKGIQDGKSKVNSVLTTIGSAIGVATSAAVMYETIKKMTS